jgi:hypothetical protein
MKIDIEIEKIVLNGVEDYDNKEFSLALGQELTRLIKENGLPEEFIKGEELGNIILSFNSLEKTTSEILGIDIARSLFTHGRTNKKN